MSCKSSCLLVWRPMSFKHHVNYHIDYTKKKILLLQGPLVIPTSTWIKIMEGECIPKKINCSTNNLAMKASVFVFYSKLLSSGFWDSSLIK